MDTKHTDGGPAFPHMMAARHADYAAGMSLRDWFAGQIIASLAVRMVEVVEADLSDADSVLRSFSRAAYKVADAMLAERAKAEGK